MLEIDVDVWRFLAFAREEPLEQETGLRRIHASNAKTETDGRVGRRAPWSTGPLCEQEARLGNASLPLSMSGVPGGVAAWILAAPVHQDTRMPIRRG